MKIYCSNVFEYSIVFEYQYQYSNAVSIVIRFILQSTLILNLKFIEYPIKTVTQYIQYSILYSNIRIRNLRTVQYRYSTVRTVQ